MTLDIKAAIHKPWVKYGLLAIGFVGVIFIIRQRESAVTSSDSGSSSGDAAAQAAVAQTQIQASAGAAAQESGQQFQLAQQKEADTTALAGQSANIAGQLQLTTLNNTHDESLANVQLQGLLAQLKQSTDLAALNAQTQQHISDNQTAVATGQTQGQVSVAKNSSKNSLIAAGIGAVIAFF